MLFSEIILGVKNNFDQILVKLTRLENGAEMIRK